MIKTKRLNQSGTKVFAGAMAIICMLTITSCARKLTFGSSSVIPEASGYVKIKTDKNQNKTISLRVDNLIEPRKVNPAATTYVVWMETKRNGVQNIGSLLPAGSIFSRRQRASLQTVTPYQPVGFFITVERDAATAFPGQQVVLKTR